MSNPTPGPWHVKSGAVYDTRTVRIALMDRAEPLTAPWERDANARLIAAAPELLEALHDLVALYAATNGADPHFVRKGQAALTKARGE